MATTKTLESITMDIIDWFDENPGALAEVIEELDNWNGYLGDDRYYSMDCLEEFYHSTDPIELLNRAYYGYDLDNWYYDSNGEKVYTSFNPNRDYFSYNGYGNLVSTDFPDYSIHNDRWFIDNLLENRNHVDTVEEYEELSTLLDELENAYSEEV